MWGGNCFFVVVESNKINKNTCSIDKRIKNFSANVQNYPNKFILYK